MDFFFWTPIMAMMGFLFAIAIPVIIVLVVIALIISHRDNQNATKTGATGENPGNARKLYKSETDKMLAGVCGGIAEYFGIDSTIVRIGLVFFTFCGGSGILFYIIAAIAMPHKAGPTAV